MINFCCVKEWEDNPQTGRKYLQKALAKGPVPQIYKKFLKLNN